MVRDKMAALLGISSVGSGTKRPVSKACRLVSAGFVRVQ
jgi:hypothetical protein